MGIKSALKALSLNINEDYPKEIHSKSLERMRFYLENFASFVQEHPTMSYYPISKLYEASRCVTPLEVLKITNYLTSDRVNFLDITFCYYPLASDDVIVISAESYRESIDENLPPVDEMTGEEIKDFDRSRLGFFCYVKELNKRAGT